MRVFNRLVRDAGHFAPFVAGAVAMLAAASQSTLAQAPAPGPEIDPGSIGSAITLFVGGALYLTSRRRAK